MGSGNKNQSFWCIKINDNSSKAHQTGLKVESERVRVRERERRMKKSAEGAQTGANILTKKGGPLELAGFWWTLFLLELNSQNLNFR